MPTQTQQAVDWALQQTWDDPYGEQHTVTKDDTLFLVTYVRQYFNDNNIIYSTFSYKDLKPYLN